MNGSLVNNAGETGLVILSDASGTGSLIHNSATVPVTFQRYIKGDPEAWHMLSSPVSSQEISGDFTPSGTYADGTGYDFYTWYEPDSSWVYLLNTAYTPTWLEANGNNNFLPGKSYLVSYEAANPTKEFTGNLNNGTISVDITKTVGVGDVFGANLVGNPYPSSIDWKSSAGWDRSDLLSVGGGYDIWLWNDIANNYGVYNSASAIDEGSLGASRYIPPNQGFFVTAQQSGALEMTNEVRSNEDAGNWLKSSEKAGNMLFIAVESSGGDGNDEVIVEFGHQDKEKGSLKKFSFIETAPSLYLHNGELAYSLVMLDSIPNHPVLPLSFKAGSNGEYVLNAFFDPDYLTFLRLKDLLLDEEIDLIKYPSHRFQAHQSDLAGRFVLQFAPGNFPNPHNKIPVRIYTYNKILFIDLRLIDSDCTVETFDTMGRMVMNTILKGGNQYEINSGNLSGIYIVRVSASDGHVINKVIF